MAKLLKKQAYLGNKKVTILEKDDSEGDYTLCQGEWSYRPKEDKPIEKMDE